jgi:Tol biopolymer transport system component/DNA-binding winged helix-turn-helix (wHTH) protein
MRFGPYRVDPQTGELWNGGIRLKVPEQPFQVLVALVERPGELVTREELRDRLWPEDTHVDYDHALTTAVKKLRRALHDSPLHPRYIETLPKRGYRFIAPVEEGEALVAAPAVVEAPPAIQAGPDRSADRLRFQRNVAIGALAVAGLGAFLWNARPEPAREPPPVRRFTIQPAGPPEGRGLSASVSPNGTMLAWVTPEQNSPIWIRTFDREQPRRLDGTEGADLVSWSPDSQSLAFATDSTLRKVSVYGGPVTTLCPLSGSIYGGSAWSPDGETIVFSTGLPPVLFEVSSRGGQPTPLPDPVVTPAGGGNLDPSFIQAPGRRLLAFSAGGPNSHDIIVRDLDSGQQAALGPGRRANYWKGMLLYQADGAEGGLWAMPFDVEELSSSGPPQRVAETGVQPTLSNGGTLVYVDEPRPAPQQLALYDRSGERMRFVGRRQDRIATPAFSPDGNRIALRGLEQGNYDIWVQSVDDLSRTRISSNLAIDADPVWSPRGDRVAWRADREGNAQIYSRSIDGQDEESPLIVGPAAERPVDWGAGERLLYTTSDFDAGADLWIVQPGTDGGAVQARPLLESSFNETNGRLSPDGRYLAYCSDESGVYEVYVRPFGDGGRPRQISRSGGCQPRWSGAGDELFFVSGDGLYAAPMAENEDALPDATPIPLFEHASLSTSSPFTTMYDVAPDGQTFVLVETLESPAGRSAGSVVRVVENWWVEVGAAFEPRP